MLFSLASIWPLRLQGSSALVWSELFLGWETESRFCPQLAAPSRCERADVAISTVNKNMYDLCVIFPVLDGALEVAELAVYRVKAAEC